MFIFRKKQFALILSCLFVSFSFYIASNNIKNRSFDITQVSSLPIDEKIIVLDAGHRSEKMEEL